MRFFQILASSAAFIAAALAALEINEYPRGGVQAGQTYTITYSPKDNTPTTFILRKGDNPKNLDVVGTLTSTATGGTFSWTVDKDLPNAPNYALEIVQGTGEPNYSDRFPLTGGSAAVSSASASASSAASVSSRASASAASASISSLISSVASSVQASATGTGSSTASHNGTVSSATLSRTSATNSRATGSATGSATIPENSSAAGSLSSAPLALLFGAAGAFAFLN